MNVTFLSPSVSRAAGGIFEIVRSLALTLSTSPDTNLAVFGLEDEFTAADAGAWHPVPVNTYKALAPSAFGYSPSLNASANGRCFFGGTLLPRIMCLRNSDWSTCASVSPLTDLRDDAFPHTHN
jgi:hypothetical protein